MLTSQTAKMSKILVGGGTGFVGQELCKVLEERGYDVTLISRTSGLKRVTWDELRETGKLPECDAVINLASANLMDTTKRFTPEFQSAIRKSTIEPTKLLAELIVKAKNPPKVWISCSAVGIYPTSFTAEHTEDTPRPSDSEQTYFTKLSCDREDAASLPSDHSCRQVIARLGMVIGRGGGPIQSAIWQFWFGLGGITGTGKQFVSWIHISDAVGIFVHALENENVSGVLNFTSPHPVTNEEFTKQLASALWRPAFIPMPAFVVNWIFGPERGTILLEGQKAIPKRTLESGYSFLFPDINSCLHDIVK